MVLNKQYRKIIFEELKDAKIDKPIELPYDSSELRKIFLELDYNK